MSDEAQPNPLPRLPENLPEALRSTLDGVVSRGINGIGPLRSAKDVAAEHLEVTGGREEGLSRLVRTHVRLAGTTGFVTGLGGIAALPVALPAAVGGLYLISARMTAAIAHVNGYDVASEEVRSAVAVCLIGTAGSEAVKHAGVEASRRFLIASLRRMSARPLLAVNRAVGFRLVTKTGTTGIVNLSRMVPFVGGPIGGAVDATACKAIARYALRTFPPAERPGSERTCD